MHKHKQSQCKRKVKHRKNLMGLIIFCITVCIVFMFAYYQNLRKEISVRQEWLETVLTREKKWILENQGPEGEIYMNGSKAGDVNPYFACVAALQTVMQNMIRIITVFRCSAFLLHGFCLCLCIYILQDFSDFDTCRPEGVEAGTLKLVGTKMEDIYRACRQLLTEPEIYREMSEARNPYGDGTASIKIRKILEDIDA